MPFCNVCNKENISEDLSTIGDQSVCCLSCVGLLKANKNDACSYCRRPVWKDNYYEVDNLYFCSEKCKNIIQKKLIKEKGNKYIKFRHFKEEKYFNEKLENNLNNLDESNYENNEWNKNSFIQKESDKNGSHYKEDNKDDMKIVYRIEKSIHKKNIYNRKNINNNINEPFIYSKKQKNSFIKNMKRYFSENKPFSNHNYNNHKNYQTKTNRKKEYTKSRLTNYKNKISINKNIPFFSNLNNDIFPINDMYYIEKNPFTHNNAYKEKISIQDRSKTLKNEDKLSNTMGYCSNSNLVFNPIRKTENTDIIKKNSYPLDSLIFPIDSMKMENRNRDSSINCCNNCKKPIIIRNSNIHKDFCSSDCRNEYYKKIPK